MPDGSQITVRRARLDDWPAIWTIFRDVVAGGDTYTYDPDISETDARTAWLHIDDPRTVTFVAESNGFIVGTALHPRRLPSRS
jgi:L-amino acid N-acyltransferase YncA